MLGQGAMPSQGKGPAAMEGPGDRVPPRPRIADFFAGRYVLVTGATGFMGKVLVEKLIRSCPGLGGVFLLLRPKRGKDVQDRVKEILQSPVSPTPRTPQSSQPRR